LSAKITNAQAMLGTNDLAGTCGILNAFINELNAQTGKKIDSATSLITETTRIEAVLCC
jgi:hypothetical protein